MAQPLGDAVPGLRVQLAFDNPTAGHRRQLSCHRAIVICRTLMPQPMRNDAEAGARHAKALHHVPQSAQGLLQRQARIADAVIDADDHASRVVDGPHAHQGVDREHPRTPKALLGGKSDSPLAIIDDLVDMEIFTADPAEAQGFDKFLDGVVVISLGALGQDDRTKNMLVAVMLNMFYEYMLKIPKRPFQGSDPQLRVLDSYLLVDEADNIMRYEFDVLRKVLLQGREFGTGVILASQYLRHSKVNATDYREPLLTWFIHKVPNVTAAELGALGFTSDLGELVDRVKTLPNHQCLFKSFNAPGDVIRGTPFYELKRPDATR